MTQLQSTTAVQHKPKYRVGLDRQMPASKNTGNSTYTSTHIDLSVAFFFLSQSMLPGVLAGTLPAGADCIHPGFRVLDKRFSPIPENPYPWQLI